MNKTHRIRVPTQSPLAMQCRKHKGVHYHLIVVKVQAPHLVILKHTHSGEWGWGCFIIAWQGWKSRLPIHPLLA